jgi:hypothetical protein
VKRIPANSRHADPDQPARLTYPDGETWCGTVKCLRRDAAEFLSLWKGSRTTICFGRLWYIGNNGRLRLDYTQKMESA